MRGKRDERSGICHLGFGFSLHGSINNAARLGRMICGHNACCGWNKYILKFRRERERTPHLPCPPFSLFHPLPLLAACAGGTLALLISAAGFYEASRRGVRRLQLRRVFGLVWFGFHFLAWLGVPTPRHMQLSAHVCSCPASASAFLLGHLCDVPCKILQLFGERAGVARVATLTPH